MGRSKLHLESQIVRTLAEVLHDLEDPRVPPFVGVERVDVAPDLANAVVYVGLEPDSPAFAVLYHARRYIQDELAQRMRLRRIPRLKFVASEAAPAARRCRYSSEAALAARRCRYSTNPGEKP